MPKRACLRYHIGACSGPCIGAVSAEEYGEKVKRATSVLKGNIRELIESMETEMRELAAKQQFEQAMALRDEIAALENLQEKQNMERQKKHNEDILNYIVRDDTVYLMLFKVYKGTLEDKQDYVFAFGENFLEEFLVQYYSENEPPEELILPEPLEESLVDFLFTCERKKSKSYGSETGREKRTSRPCPEKC